MGQEIKAPDKFDSLKYSVFLGGAIDQGRESTNWQQKVVSALSDLDIILLNPRRAEWDESWEQCLNCEPFREQVMWEIKAQEKCDLVLYVYTKDSKAPITMFEHGKWGTTKDCMVCVEEGFYRQGNLDIYNEYFQISAYHNLDEMIIDLHTALEDKA